MFQSRFEKRFFIDAGVIVKGIPFGDLESHLYSRIDDDVIPYERNLEDVLNLQNSMREQDRETFLSRTAEYLTNQMDALWSDKDWLFQQARLPFNPNMPILQSLVKHVAAHDNNNEI